MPPEAIARGVAARIVSGAQARALAKFRADADSPRGKVRRSLVARLRHRPHPSLDEIRQWAQLAGKRFDQEVDWVWSVWRPYLQRRGLIPRGGRPSTTADRHRVILELLANEGLTPFEPRMRWGFWKEALAEVRKVDGDRAPKNAVALRAWWAGHLASCTECDKLRPSN
jgi:hypothetical protein